MVRAAVALAFCIIFGSGPAGAAGERPDLAQTNLGTVQGSVADGVAAFRGIPYAAPPVGALRWRPPQPATPWQDTRNATAFGPSCMQTRVPFTPAPGELSEDCLTLNVWTPAEHSGARLPVMVWIHGGGFFNGTSAAGLYDGAGFARQGVILVSMNYRLGRFGFFAHPALTKEHPDEPKGNYAFMDQIAALQWVQANIAAFGGDAGNVTIFGKSAGARAADALLISPAARRLFAKAIIKSSTQRQANAVPLQDRDHGATRSGEAIGENFAKSVGVVTGDAAALRAIPADAVVGGIAMGVGQPATYAGPMVDGTILTEPYEEAFATGHIARVPLIIGTNDYESKVFEAGLDYGALLERLGAAKDTVLAAYKAAYADEADRKTRFMTEMMYFEPTRFMARQMAKSGQPSYFYRFSYVAEGLRGKVLGALHASEMPYVFDNLPAAPETSMSKVWLDALYTGGFAPTPRDRAVAKAMNAYWIGFAKTGDPNGAGRPHWASVSADPDAILEVGAEGPRGVTDPVKARLDALEPMNAPGWR